jgi:hypothetical protein
MCLSAAVEPIAPAEAHALAGRLHIILLLRSSLAPIIARHHGLPFWLCIHYNGDLLFALVGRPVS